MGAAGLVSSSSEMASKAGSGLILNLDDVPQRESGMTPYEMMLSESQERMLICVTKGFEDRVKELFSRYELDAVTIGEVTGDGQYRLYHEGRLVADLPVDALAEEAPVYHKPYTEPERIQAFKKLDAYKPDIKDTEETLKQLMQQPTVASKKSVFETYDSMVRTNTVVGPGSDAAVLRIRGTRKALAMTTDCNARYLYLDPDKGGQMAVAEAARNIVASGGEPLAITDCLNYGNPDKPEVFWELWTSADGIAKACTTLNTPVISGNVSLYNETNGEAIYPTPMIGMVGLVKDLDHVTTSEFKQAGDKIFVIGKTGADFNGSELQKMQLGRIEGELFDFDIDKEKMIQDKVLQAIREGLIQSAHDCSEGGLAVALMESAFGNELGLSATLDMPSEWLFSESPSRFVLSVRPEHVEEVKEVFGQDAVEIGEVKDTRIAEIRTQTEKLTIDVKEVKDLWEGAIPWLLKSKA